MTAPTPNEKLLKRAQHAEAQRRQRLLVQRARVQRVHTIFDPPATDPGEGWPAWRTACNHVIFGADTEAGKWFDWILLVFIAASVVTVMLDSVTPIRDVWGSQLKAVEWALTLVFTVEYVARLFFVKRPSGYARSFFGVVDLISLLPTWLSLAVEGSEVLAVIRVLRMLRLFRLMQLSQFIDESEALATALAASVSRIIVFLGGVLTIVVIMGSTMYLVEGSDAGFDSIPRGVYWAIVTLTTVGYGDIAPRTALGQAIAAAVMVLGYAIIAVPTGIVSAELVREQRDASGESPAIATPLCPSCSAAGHDSDAQFCRICGVSLLSSLATTTPTPDAPHRSDAE